MKVDGSCTGRGRRSIRLGFIDHEMQHAVTIDEVHELDARLYAPLGNVFTLLRRPKDTR
jgi:hypothetical protein